MVNVIIPKEDALGKTRSEIERNMLKEGGYSNLSEEQLDKCAFLERERRKRTGLKKMFFQKTDIDKVK